MTEEARRALSRIPLFAGRPLGNIAVEPLPGLTNRTCKLALDGEAFVLRIPGPGTGRYIDRAAEEHNARVAAAVGVGPEVLFFDRADGLMLTRFVAGADILDAGRLREPALLRRAVRTLRRLHGCGRRFHARMDLFGRLDLYLALAAERGIAAPPELVAARAAATPVRDALARGAAPEAPCHIDPVPHNFLALGEADGGMILLDWEYSAMCEPIWDLADLSVEARFDAAQDAAMLETYYGAAAPAAAGRLALYKAMLDLLAAAWSWLQVADGNRNADFRALAAERLARCRAAMAAPA